MMSNISESEKLFSKFVPITLKDNITNSCRIIKLFLTVEWQLSSVAVQRQELVVTVTDDNDPFFLYSLNLCEEDFQTLKGAQGLLVDFRAFPQRFIDLLELCIQEEQKTQPKFVLILNIEDRFSSPLKNSQIDVVETNPFKYLTHLSLKLVPASDSSAKQYSSACYKKLKEKCHQFEKRIDYLEKELLSSQSQLSDVLSSKTKEVESVRQELSAELSVSSSWLTRTFEDERDQLSKKHKEEKQQLEKEIKEKETNLKKQVQQLEARVSCLDTLNKEIQDKNYNCDRTVRALESQNRSVDAEFQKAKELCHNSAQKIESSLSEIREKKMQITRLKDTIHELEQHLSEKNELIQRIQKNMDISLEQKKSLETELEEKRCRIESHEKSENSLTQQIEKSNSIIDQLMAEVRTCQDKLRVRFKISLKQEETIEEKVKFISCLKKEICELKDQLTSKEAEIKNLSQSVASLQETTKHFETELKARENVIKWLNRQMTDACLVPQYTPPDNLMKNLANLSEPKDNRSKIPTPFTLNSKLSPTIDSTAEKYLKQKPISESTMNEHSSTRSISTYPQSTSSGKIADSAYSTSSSTLVSQIPAEDFSDIDSAIMNAAFGSGENQIPLHKQKDTPVVGRTKTKRK